MCTVRVRTRGEDAHLCAKEGEASGGTNPADAWISDLQLPGWDPWAAWLGCVTFRSGSTRYFVIVLSTVLLGLRPSMGVERRKVHLVISECPKDYDCLLPRA